MRSWSIVARVRGGVGVGFVCPAGQFGLTSAGEITIVNAALLTSQLLDAIPSYVFAVDEDVRILQYNAAAAALLGTNDPDVLRRRGGEVLHCIHATDSPEGCGHGPSCRTCVVRNSVTAALTEGKRIRQRARLELVSGGKRQEVFLLVSASP